MAESAKAHVKSQMAALVRVIIEALPGPALRYFRGEAQPIRLHHSGDELVAVTGARHRHAIRRVRLDDAPGIASLIRSLPGGTATNGNIVVELSLDRDLWQVASLLLPKAAEAELDGILSIEVERLFPAPLDQILFGYTVERSEEEEIAVELVVIPRRVVDPVVEKVEAAGFRVGRIVRAHSDTMRREIHPAIVFADALTPSRATARRRAAAALALVFLIIMATFSPLWRLHVAEQTLLGEVDAARISSKKTMTLVASIERAENRRAARANLSQNSPSPVEMLEALSELLPDDTWLIHLTMNGPQIRLEGRTRSSTRLVKLFESSPMFESVDYQSAITRDPSGGMERFAFSLGFAGKRK